MSGTIPVTDSTSIDLGSLETAASELQFQDFPVTRSNVAGGGTDSSDHKPTISAPNNTFHEDSRNLLLGSGSPDGDDLEEDTLFDSSGKQRQPPQQQPSGSILEMAFFAKYFDVTTQDVVSRIIYSVLPFSKSGGTTGSTSMSFVERFIRSNPDLYGPLWINVTLIFCIAICGNIANYFSSMDPDSWHYDFTKVGLAASTVSSYIIVVPVFLWFLFWFRGCTAMFTLLETICVYGYSMSVYVPISILWVFSPRLVQFILVIFGGVLSGSVLSLSFSPVVKSDPSSTVNFSYLILFLIMGLHALLALTFLMYFF